jgi:hypothetical protein
VRAHAGEAGADVHACVAELVANRARHRERGLPLQRVAGLLDGADQLRDGVLLRLRERVQFVEHLRGALAHGTVGMRAQSCGVGGRKRGEDRRPACHGRRASGLSAGILSDSRDGCLP